MSDNCTPVLKLYIISGLTNLCNNFFFRTEGGKLYKSEYPQKAIVNISKNFYINNDSNTVKKVTTMFVQKIPFPNFYNEGGMSGLICDEERD